jgi:single-strand DNA-binding protein
MSDLNKVFIMGNVVQDVELKVLTNNTKIANIRVAMHRKYKTKTQEVKEETEFITVVVWEKLAETCGQYLKKGSRILVEGRLQTREYVDKNQQQRTVTEVKGDSVEFISIPKKEEQP